MHIAFLTSEYPPLPSGGIGTSIRNLGRALVAEGHRVSVIGPGPAAEFEDMGVRVRFLGETLVPKMGWLLNRGRVQRELNRMVREENLQIVEAHEWCGISAGLRLKCPLLVRCNGSSTYFAHLLNYRPRASVRNAERLALRGADAVAAVSRFTAEVTKRLFDLRELPHVIHNGIGLSQFQPAAPAEVEPDTILYFGTLVRKKGVLDLCRVFSRLVAEHEGARLWLVGRDSDDSLTGSPSTWALCRELLSPEARARTEFFGPQPYAKMQKYIRRAAVCAFPSYAEAMPLAWLEAMACAKPLVAYDIGWAREAVEDERSGLLVPAGDTRVFASSLKRLLLDASLRSGLAAQARARVEEKFSAQRVARETLEWYARYASDEQLQVAAA